MEDKVEFLHVNNVRAAISNRGSNFTDLTKASFKVPYISGSTPNTLFTTSLCFGGYDSNNNLFTNIKLYKSDSECGYLPGPFIEGIDGQNIEHASNWNKIFKVTGEEIMAHITDYKDFHISKVIEAIYGWPVKGNPFFKGIHGFALHDDTKAAFVETPGHENGKDEPHFGEYPKVDGVNSVSGAIFWCVYRGAIINSPYGEDMKLQIEQTAWAMSCEDDVLSNTVFTRFLVTNKSNGSYHNFRFGLFTDPDLGCYEDDYVGSFPDLNSYLPF